MRAHSKSVLLALILAGLIGSPAGAAIAADPPPNDDISSARLITATYDPVTDITEATYSSSDPHPTCTPNTGQESIWYQIAPSGNIALTVDTNGSTYTNGTPFDTVLAVYSSSLTELACKDEGGATASVSKIANLNLTGGSTYFIMVIGYAGGSDGSVHLNASYVSLPNTLTPADGVAGVSGHSALSWTSAGSGLTYSVDLGTDPGALAAVSGCQGISTLTCSPGTLSPNTTYYWTVRVSDGTNEGSINPPRSFTTGVNHAPNQPGNQWPPYGATGISRPVTVTWEGGDPDSGDSVTYQVSVGLDYDTLNPVTCADNTIPSCTLDGLSSNTTYTMNVVATDSYGLTSESVWGFTTAMVANTAPNVPALTAPDDAATGVSLKPTLSWTGGDPDAGDSATYTVYLSQASQPLDPVASTVTPQQWTVSNSLLPLTAYHWMIRATDTQGVTSDSAVRSFTTGVNHAPNVPALTAPDDAATAVSLTPTFSWTGGDPDAGDSATYTIYLDQTNPPTTEMANQVPSQYWTGSSSLSPLTTYYWKIRATDSYGMTSDSAVRSFTTRDTPVNQAPNTPTGPSPADGASGVFQPVTLTWTGGDPDAGDTVTYQVYWGISAGSLSPITCNNSSAASCSPGSLASSQTYYWKVVATDSHAASATGGPWSFTIVAGAPTAPNAPSNLTVTATSGSQINLSWTDNSTDEASFRIERSTKSSSGWGEIKAVASNVTAYSDAGLPCGTRYYYRVRARNDAGYSAYSSTANAATTSCAALPKALKAPKLLTPKGSLLTNVQTQVFTWKPVTGATGYRIQIATDKKFTAFLINELVAGPTYTAVDMPEGVTYWRVATMNSERQGRFSGRRTLTIDITPPAVPVITSPLNPSSIADRTPRLLVQKSYSATRYEFQVSTDASFTAPVLIDVTVRSRSYTIPRARALTSGPTYYWRVAAIDKAGNVSGWSVTGTFTID